MIYLDHHATTPLDPLALEAMLPLMNQHFANAGSITHEAGRQVAEIVERCTVELAHCIGATEDELVFTSGATESNNLALFGACLHPRQLRRKVVSVVTEHKAILDPLHRLQQLGFEVVLVRVEPNSSDLAGQVDLQQLEDAIDAGTALVSVMLANNEIGVIQPLEEISRLCRRVDCLLHTDATQAVGRLAVDVDRLGVDLLSFSAHKFYGPKGVGGLYVRRRDRKLRLQPQIVGGGQQHNLRSGTLNTAGIVGMHAALLSCLGSLEEDRPRIAGWRDQLFALLRQHAGAQLNGPPLRVQGQPSPRRLMGNLSCSFYPIEGQSLMLAVPELAVSSGSACTSANPAPSHVLRAIGLTEDATRSSIRFGLGRFNTWAEIEQAADWLVSATARLKTLI